MKPLLPPIAAAAAIAAVGSIPAGARAQPAASDPPQAVAAAPNPWERARFSTVIGAGGVPLNVVEAGDPSLQGRCDAREPVRRPRDRRPRRRANNDPVAAITSPVTLVFGGRDPIVGPAAAQRVATLWPAARVKTFAGSGHAPFIDEARRFNALVESLQCRPR